MAGYFTIGETKIRPGAYFNVQAKGEEDGFGAVDGIVAVLFKSNMGPLNKVVELSATSGYASIFGTDKTTDAIREAFYGGAVKVLACRIGTGGAAASASLEAASGTVEVAAKYPGAVDYTVTVRTKLSDSAKKEIIFYVGETEYERYSFTAGDDEVAACVAACSSSTLFDVTASEGASGVITAVSQSALSGGEDPTVTTSNYSEGLTLVEPYYFNTICVDTEDADVQALVVAFLDRIYAAGQFGIAVFAPDSSMSYEERMTAAEAFNAENVAYIINPTCMAGDVELKGYQVAALIAGLIAATPASKAVTHSVIDRYTTLEERMTNSAMEAAQQRGCLCLSVSSKDQVWLDNGITTLINPDSNHDSGWKKIRRVKTRYELLYRANAAAEALVGQVNNDVNGRATIAGAIQAICNDMIDEGKIQYGDVQESTKIVADGDTCGFDIDVIDLDSAEHIYLIYYFRYSTVVE